MNKAIYRIEIETHPGKPHRFVVYKWKLDGCFSFETMKKACNWIARNYQIFGEERGDE